MTTVSLRYRTIVADPPWQSPDSRGRVGRTKGGGEGWQRHELPYSSLSVEEIAALPIAQQASLICFLRGRVRFVRAVGIERNGHNAAAPSCLMAFGDECAEIVRSSGLGLCGVLA